jgi:hypothetical protein
MELHASDDYAALAVSVDIAVERMTLTYEFKNHSALELFLFNRLFRLFNDGSYPVDPNRVEIEIREQRIVVSKKLVPIPDDMDVEHPHIPCASRVAPGETFAERICVALPLVPRTPYLREFGRKPRRRALHVELGYARGGPDPRGAPAVVPITGGGTALLFDTFTESDQRLLTLGPFGDVPTLED